MHQIKSLTFNLREGISGTIILFLFIICSGWTLYSAINLTDGCVKETCKYITNDTFNTPNCVVIVINKPEFNCTYTNLKCPLNLTTNCYIFNNRHCPYIETCVNDSHVLQIIISVLLIFILVIIAVSFVIYIERNKIQYTEYMEL